MDRPSRRPYLDLGGRGAGQPASSPAATPPGQAHPIAQAATGQSQLSLPHALGTGSPTPTLLCWVALAVLDSLVDQTALKLTEIRPPLLQVRCWASSSVTAGERPGGGGVRREEGIPPLPMPPHWKTRFGISSPTLTPSGAGSPAPCHQGRLYDAAKARCRAHAPALQSLVPDLPPVAGGKGRELGRASLPHPRHHTTTWQTREGTRNRLLVHTQESQKNSKVKAIKYTQRTCRVKSEKKVYTHTNKIKNTKINMQKKRKSPDTTL